MSDTLSSPNAIKPLSNQAKELEDRGLFAQALDLYQQLYAQQAESSFAACGCLRCLRRLNRAEAAVHFGRSLPPQLLDAPYVHRALAWAIYDYYFKTAEQKHDESFGDSDSGQRASGDHRYEQMQKAANYVLQRSPVQDTMIRNRIVFGICSEARQRERWQDMYHFATQLSPEALSTEPRKYGGYEYMSDYQRWLYLLIKPALELQRYDECLQLAQQGCTTYPTDKNFPWWRALAKRALGQPEEALNELKSLNTRFPEWYIQRDIADICAQLQLYQEAWTWYCKAALRPGPLSSRYRLFWSMATLLQHLERWTDAYAHLHLAHLITKEEGWSRSEEALRLQLTQLATHDALQGQQAQMAADLPTMVRQLKQLWQQEVSATQFHLGDEIEL